MNIAELVQSFEDVHAQVAAEQAGMGDPHSDASVDMLRWNYLDGLRVAYNTARELAMACMPRDNPSRCPYCDRLLSIADPRCVCFMSQP